MVSLAHALSSIVYLARGNPLNCNSLQLQREALENVREKMTARGIYGEAAAEAVLRMLLETGDTSTIATFR